MHTSDQGLAHRYPELLRLARFIVVGTLNTGFSYLVYCIALYAGAPYAIANLIACIAGILLGYRTHLRFVFADASSPQLRRYVLVWLTLYLVNIGLIRLFVGFGLSAYAAGAVALPLMVAASFVLNRWVVFRRADASSR